MAKAKEAEQTQTFLPLVRVLLLIGFIVFLTGGALWWKNIANNPRNVFYGMLDNSMKTRGIGRHVMQDNGAQQLDQRTRLTLGQTAQASSSTVLTQNETTSVRTDSIGTPTQDYVRYGAIDTDQPGSDGQPLNFDEILGVWGKAENIDQINETRGELFGETVLGVVPLGFVRYEKRAELMDFIREQNVYNTDFSAATREIVNGRPQYTYNVQVTSQNYITMLKQFATAVGLNQLEAIDPAAFSDVAPFEFSVVVDIWSKQLVSIQYANSARTEDYGSYGQETVVMPPEQTISIDELQLRLQNIQ